MPRAPRKFKADSSKPVQITFLVESSTAAEIDAYAARLTDEDPDRPANRTVALKKLIRAGLDSVRK